MSGESVNNAPKRGKPFAKGNTGRPKGAQNKFTGELKDMILNALAGAGGVEYLKQQAKDNPGPFMGLVGKVLPMQVTGKDGGPIVMSWATDAEDAPLAIGKAPERG